MRHITTIRRTDIPFITPILRPTAIRPLTTRRLGRTEFHKPHMALTEDLQPEARRTILTPGPRLTLHRLLMLMGARKLAQRITHIQVRLLPPGKARTGTARGEVPRPSPRMVRALIRNTTPQHRERRDQSRRLPAEKPLARAARMVIACLQAKLRTAICMPARTATSTRTLAAVGRRRAATEAGIP